MAQKALFTCVVKTKANYYKQQELERMATSRIYFTTLFAINTKSDYLQSYGDTKLTHLNT